MFFCGKNFPKPVYFSPTVIFSPLLSYKPRPCITILVVSFKEREYNRRKKSIGIHIQVRSTKGCDRGWRIRMPVLLQIVSWRERDERWDLGVTDEVVMMVMMCACISR